MAMSTPIVDAPFRRSTNRNIDFRPVLVTHERCKGCGLCIDACTPHVLELDMGVVNAMGHHPVRLIDASGCTSCAKCARVCPDAALTIFARPKGA
jgi:2-oxoglutarate ferredoxin oxidoreductase subunit delta